MKKAVITLICTITGSVLLWGDNISISGIDTGSMIFNGNVSLYLNITDDQGAPVRGLTGEDVSIAESTDGSTYNPAEIVTFKAGENEDKGIRFKLLIDNSGSMYETLDGEETEDYESTRIHAAVNATKSLIMSMQGSRDKAGLSLFNTYYEELSPVGSNRNLVIESMQMIEEPGKDESFTELNASVVTAAEDFSIMRGRKILIVLSDGENYPFYPVRDTANPQFGTRLFTSEEMISELKKSGTTLYGISFATDRDPSLEQVAIATGGLLFEARTEEDLRNVYKTIRERILSEYYVEYKTGTDFAEKKFVKAELTSLSVPSEVHYFFSGTLFGKPSEEFNWLYLLALPLAIALFVFLALQKLSAPAEKAGLEVTDFSGSTQMFDLDSPKTVIGGSDNDDVTVVSESGESQSNATIVFDEKKSVYTVVSDKEVMVNNNPVKKRELEPGDVLTINGATVVFNDKADK